jgi:serine protease Do
MAIIQARHWWGLLLVAAFACQRSPTSGETGIELLPQAPQDLGVPPTTPPPAPTTTCAAASDLEHAFERASEVIAPSLVSIRSERTLKRPPLPIFPFDEDDLFPDFLRRPLPQQLPQELRQRGLGSGVIVRADGYILTNNHVVEGADELEVVLTDDRRLRSDVVGTDPHTDIAVIKVDAQGLTPATLGDSERLRVGQWVLAAGSPFGLNQTISAGIISAIGRTNMGITDYEQFIQTDAAINPGNSGGPLIDLQGRVVGINTAIASSGGGSNGVGFAVPVDMARQVMEQIITGGKVIRGWLGVVIGPLTPELARSFDYSGAEGILVQDVVGDGPASAAGLRSGDIILERDGKPVRDATSFRTEVAQLAPGTRVTLKLWRAGKTEIVEVTLGQLPDLQDRSIRPALPRLGLELGDLTEELRRRFDLDASSGALVLTVEPGSLAETAGLRPGDVIEQVGDDPVKTAAEASTRLSGAALDRGVRLRIRRGKYGHFVVLRARTP